MVTLSFQKYDFENSRHLTKIISEQIRCRVQAPHLRLPPFTGFIFNVTHFSGPQLIIESNPQMDSGKLIDTLARNVIIPRGRKFSECNDPRNCSRVDTNKRETERRPQCKKRRG